MGHPKPKFRYTSTSDNKGSKKRRRGQSAQPANPDRAPSPTTSLSEVSTASAADQQRSAPAPQAGSVSYPQNTADASDGQPPSNIPPLVEINKLAEYWDDLDTLSSGASIRPGSGPLAQSPQAPPRPPERQSSPSRYENLSSGDGLPVGNGTQATSMQPPISLPIRTAARQPQTQPTRDLAGNWRDRAQSSTDPAPTSTKQLQAGEYNSGRIVQIKKSWNNVEGWRNHPGVILDKWGQWVAVGMTTSWDGEGRDQKLSQCNDPAERDLRRSFFPLLLHAGELDHDEYGVLRYAGSRKIFQARSWFDLRGARVVHETKLERYVEKGTQDKEAVLDGKSLQFVEKYWADLIGERTFDEVRDAGDFPWNPSDLATVFRYMEGKRTGRLPEVEWAYKNLPLTRGRNS